MTSVSYGIWIDGKHEPLSKRRLVFAPRAAVRRHRPRASAASCWVRPVRFCPFPSPLPAPPPPPPGRPRPVGDDCSSAVAAAAGPGCVHALGGLGPSQCTPGLGGGGGGTHRSDGLAARPPGRIAGATFLYRLSPEVGLQASVDLSKPL